MASFVHTRNFISDYSCFGHNFVFYRANFVVPLCIIRLSCFLFWIAYAMGDPEGEQCPKQIGIFIAHLVEILMQFPTEFAETVDSFCLGWIFRLHHAVLIFNVLCNPLIKIPTQVFRHRTMCEKREDNSVLLTRILSVYCLIIIAWDAICIQLKCRETLPSKWICTYLCMGM